jgi:hypothetical protein
MVPCQLLFLCYVQYINGPQHVGAHVGQSIQKLEMYDKPNWEGLSSSCIG